MSSAVDSYLSIMALIGGILGGIYGATRPTTKNGVPYIVKTSNNVVIGAVVGAGVMIVAPFTLICIIVATLVS